MWRSLEPFKWRRIRCLAFFARLGASLRHSTVHTLKPESDSSQHRLKRLGSGIGAPLSTAVERQTEALRDVQLSVGRLPLHIAVSALPLAVL
jgi:hypothetical protein